MDTTQEPGTGDALPVTANASNPTCGVAAYSGAPSDASAKHVTCNPIVDATPLVESIDLQLSATSATTFRLHSAASTASDDHHGLGTQEKDEQTPPVTSTDFDERSAATTEDSREGELTDEGGQTPVQDRHNQPSQEAEGVHVSQVVDGNRKRVAITPLATIENRATQRARVSEQMHTSAAAAAAAAAAVQYQPPQIYAADSTLGGILQAIWSASDAAPAEAALKCLLQWLSDLLATGEPNGLLVIGLHVDSFMVGTCINRFPHSNRLFDLGCLVLARLVPLLSERQKAGFRLWGGLKILSKSITHGMDQEVVLSSLQMVSHLLGSFLDDDMPCFAKGILGCMRGHLNNAPIQLAAMELMKAMITQSEEMKQVFIKAKGPKMLSAVIARHFARGEIKSLCTTVRTMLFTPSI